MSPQIEVRKVSLAKWYDPKTWGKFIEEKVFYFTFNTLVKDQDERLHLTLAMMQTESDMDRVNNLLSNGFDPEKL